MLPRTAPLLQERAERAERDERTERAERDERAERASQAWWRRWTRPALLGPLVAAAALAMLLWWPREPAGIAVDAGADLRSKGADEQVRVYARRAGQVLRLAPGAQVQPGDALRLVVEPRGARYLLVLSVDGALASSVYHPLGGTASAALPSGMAEVELEGSLVLDETLGPERLWLLFSERPLQVAQVQARLQALISGGAGAVLGAGDDALTGELDGVEALTWSWTKVAREGGAQGP